MGKKKVVKKGKKEHKPSLSTKKSNYYKLQGDSLSRERRSCPKCGHGVFMGEHKDRFHCGSCGYSEFKTEPKLEKAVAEKTEKKVNEN